MNCETPGDGGWRLLTVEPGDLVAEIVGPVRGVGRVGLLVGWIGDPNPAVAAAVEARGGAVVTDLGGDRAGDRAGDQAGDRVDTVVVTVPADDPGVAPSLVPALAAAARHLAVGGTVVIVVEGLPGGGARPEPVLAALATTPFLAVGVRSAWGLAGSGEPEIAWCVVEAVFTGAEGIGAVWARVRALEGELDAERLARGVDAHRAARAEADANALRDDARAARDELRRLRATRLFRWAAPWRAAYAWLRDRAGGTR